MANEYLNKEEFTYLVQLIKEEFLKYVQAEAGKGLSTEDFTTELKQKLEDLGVPESFVYIPSVSESGDLSWTNNGGLENPPTVNIKGDDGYTPVKGTDYYTEVEKQEIINETKAFTDEETDKKYTLRVINSKMYLVEEGEEY